MINVNYRNTLANELKQQRKKMKIPFIQQSGKEIAKNLLEQKKATPEYQNARIQKFIDLFKNPEGKLTKKLNKNIAIDIIEAGKGEYVAEYIENFSSKDHKEIAKTLIDHRLGTKVINNLDKFNNFINYSELAGILIDELKGKHEKIEDISAEDFEVLFNKFEGTDPVAILLEIIKKYPKTIAANIHKIPGIDKKDLNIKVIQSCDVEKLEIYFEELKEYNQPYSDYNEIADIILTNKSINIVDYLHKLKYKNLLNQNIMEKFIKQNDQNLAFVLQNIDAFDHNAKRWILESRENKNIKKAQNRGPEIKLTKAEINVVKKLISSGWLIYQRSFAQTYLDESGSLYITKSSFSGNILESINKYAEEIYKETGIWFCYHPRKHNPISEKDYHGYDFWGFTLVPCSIETGKQLEYNKVN